MPCIRGKLGSTEYFLSKMTAIDLVRTVRVASDLDEWANMGIEERIQRDANIRRVEIEIAPYIANTPDRFFGALIILMYKGELEFEELSGFEPKIKSIFISASKGMGFLTIDGATLIVLDGQHRLLALEKVVKHSIDGPYADDVPQDDISVIFIKYEGSEKTRRIFNKVNKYAKPTSRGDNIITNEDDARAIISRMLMGQDEPFGITYGTDQESIVNWKSTTISPRSLQFTTISALYEIAKTIFDSKNIEISQHLRPTDEKLENLFKIVKNYWEKVIFHFSIYQKALNNNKLLPKFREPDEKFSLLFKPAAQMSLFKAITNAEKLGMDLDEILKRLAKINWSMTAPQWKDIIVRSNWTIDAKLEAQDRAAQLMVYLIASHKMKTSQINSVKRMYSDARKSEEKLPDPIIL